MNFDLDVFLTPLFSWVFMKAALITLALAASAHAGAILISVPMALGLNSHSRLLKAAIRLYVGIFRAIPTLLWMLFFWNAMPQFSAVFRESWYTPFMAAWIALVVNEAAYQVEINRAALNAVDRAQIQAATAFGFHPLQIFRLVTLPQAARVALPPTVNEFITLLKATSLASVISLQELMTVTNQAVATTFQFQEYYAAAAVYYLVIVTVLTLFQGRLERRFDWTTERRPGGSLIRLLGGRAR
ncbi:amino acid ABC transporter permease [Zavarzinia sp.]|uniref:amino acid ABC transporter permease n=1 Tax=Zavarzinia sp. TaxID=2027920 RepID=UPI003567B56C